MNRFLILPLLLLAVGTVHGDVKHLLEGKEPVAILSQDSDISPDGSYHSSFQTANGISLQESGSPKAVGTEQPVVVQGSVSYTAPDGTPVQLTYSADENGASFQGSHLPVAPPAPEIPLPIQRALEYIAAHPYVEPERKSGGRV